MSSTKRNLDAPEEDSLSRKRTPLDSNSRSLVDSANDMVLILKHKSGWFNGIILSCIYP
jgi:hypothetical protein